MPNLGVSELAAMARSAPPRLPGTRLVLVDGPAGAGKTTLANRIAVALGGVASSGAGSHDPSAPVADDAPVQVLHGDDMYEGWTGLATLDRVLMDLVLTPLARGAEGAFRMWDWHESRRSHLIRVPPRPFLIIEGVGVASRAARPHASLSLYVDAPWPTRLARGLDRDGEGLRADWERWEVSERAYLEREGARLAVDAVIDGARPVPT